MKPVTVRWWFRGTAQFGVFECGRLRGFFVTGIFGDEYFVSESAAKKGITEENTSSMSR